MAPTREQVEHVAHYTEQLLRACEALANQLAEDTGIEIEAVCLISKVKDDGAGWGATQIAGPAEWGPQDEVAMLMQGVQNYVASLGGSMNVSVTRGEAPVRPLPRRRRARPRR